MRNLEYIMNQRSPVGDVGVELEVEGKRLSEGTYFSSWPTVSGWVAKPDGSLRNGIEYVFRTPNKLEARLEKKIVALVDALKDNCADDSYRTSNHIHINALRLTPLEVANVVMSYWLVEDIVSDLWGEERKGNTYCTRVKDIPNINKFVKIFQKGRIFGFNKLPGYNNDPLGRYYGLNLSAISKFGSIEFRGMRGTIDADNIINWVKTCHHIVNVSSKKYKTPLQIFENFLNTSNQVDFLKKIIGPHYSSLVTIDDAKLDIVNDVAIKVAPFAYMFDTEEKWQKWEQKWVDERAKFQTSTTVTTSSATDARLSASEILRNYVTQGFSR